jgi:hypothetical protein
MSLIANLVVLGLVLVAIIVSGLFITRAWWINHKGGFWSSLEPWWLKKFIKRKHKSATEKAETYLWYAFLVSWLSVALVIFLVIGYISVAGETAQQTGGMASKILLIVAILAVVAQGLLAAVGAEYLRESSSQKKAFRDSVIGASVSLGSAGGLFLFQIYIAIQKKQEQKRQSQNRLRSAVITNALR